MVPGKTTLFNVLTGLYVPDEGEFRFNERDLFRAKPAPWSRPVLPALQNIRLFGNMSTLEKRQGWPS